MITIDMNTFNNLIEQLILYGGSFGYNHEEVAKILSVVAQENGKTIIMDREFFTLA